MTALRIENHLVVPDPGHPFEIVDKCDEVSERRRSLGTTTKIIKPRLLVIHYAVTDSLNATYRAQEHRGFFAHFSIDGFTEDQSGTRASRFKLIQQIPLNIRGSHAGKSEWKGLTQVNDFSIGIEISNPGPLKRGPDGKLRTVYEKEWPEDDAVEGVSPLRPEKHWARYSPEELSICATLAIALRDAGLIKEIVGHSDIAPKRKADPGPAFDMQWLRDLVFPPEPDTIPAPPPEAA